ncbi:MAG: hypothetical protein KDH09_06050 [Chrysiogenetes bacterium]|nr:hypothetical protein [Chrysiogenetes bacterium]
MAISECIRSGTSYRISDMKYRYLLLGVVCLLLAGVRSTFAAPADQAEGCLCATGLLSFELHAPAGWVLDSTSGRSNGLAVVLYPAGSSWSNSNVMMYINRGIASPDAKDRVADVMAVDLKRFQENSPSIVSRDMAPAKTAGGRKVLIRRFSGDKWGNNELVGYVDTPGGVGIIVLSSRSIEDFEKSIDAFRALLADFRYVPLEERMKRAMTRADEDAKRKGADAYEAQAMQQVGPYLAQTVAQCTGNAAKPTSNINVVMGIDGKGVVSDIFWRDGEPLDDCVGSALTQYRNLPAPPFSPYYWHIEIEIAE